MAVDSLDGRLREKREDGEEPVSKQPGSAGVFGEWTG